MSSSWVFRVGSLLYVTGFVRLVFVVSYDANNTIQPSWFIYAVPLILMLVGLILRGVSYYL